MLVCTREHAAQLLGADADAAVGECGLEVRSIRLEVRLLERTHTLTGVLEALGVAVVGDLRAQDLRVTKAGGLVR